MLNTFRQYDIERRNRKPKPKAETESRKKVAPNQPQQSKPQQLPSIHKKLPNEKKTSHITAIIMVVTQLASTD
ncbi:hypothetical protein AYR61_09920 [Secundilactobacillus paracollinoides]|uniref:Uncharacterized protein n=1 Tax=Secundilactobacillus paracollinoides TaxID=240427 RepID=A0A1B2IZT5_9LACO|nr:hypothetical protein AYR61_09920 [Secundilactobacillus paracollinoides]ANZ67562.1 hypothetical protein AYR63_10665 [Secundilactobacillus paracollinoides]